MKWKCQKCVGIRECHSCIIFTVLTFNNSDFFDFLPMTDRFFSRRFYKIQLDLWHQTLQFQQQIFVIVNLEGFHHFFDTKFGLKEINEFWRVFPSCFFFELYFLFLFTSRYSNIGVPHEILFLLTLSTILKNARMSTLLRVSIIWCEIDEKVAKSLKAPSIECKKWMKSRLVNLLKMVWQGSEVSPTLHYFVFFDGKSVNKDTFENLKNSREKLVNVRP